MTTTSHWTASDGTRLHYRAHNVFDYLPDRCVADALAFLKSHFPGELD